MTSSAALRAFVRVVDLKVDDLLAALELDAEGGADWDRCTVMARAALAAAYKAEAFGLVVEGRSGTA